jgi:hypothetical protein
MHDVEITKPFMKPSEWGIYALVYMQVCAHGEVPPERIEEVANAENPSGVTTSWSLTDKGPDGEDLSPVQCNDDPVRLHYMLSC